MIYLIDGHNLIGKTPDIQLSDPDDEEKLVRRLQNWARLDRKRKIQVVFDAGSHGGFGDLLSGLNVNVRFSRMGQTADAVLIRQIKGIRNPQEYTVITSDREIIAVAKKRRVGYILSEEFVSLLEEERAAMLAEANEDAKKAADVSLAEEVEVSDEEVDEWLDLFAKAPKRKRPEPPQIKVNVKPKPTEKERPLPTQKERPPASTEDLKSGESSLTREELSDWMAMFGDAPKPERAKEQSKEKRPQVKKRPSANPQPTRDDKFSGDKLSAEEVDEWLNWFGGKDE